MVNFTSEQLQQALRTPKAIRNISVIAHVDHGKSTLVDSLVSAVGILNKNLAGDACYMDSTLEEGQRGITIKASGISLYHIDSQTQEPYLVNLIDSPGHVDFSTEVTAALRITDGAVVVVDIVQGVCVQTQTVLRQAIQQQVRPILFINKLDRSFLELKQDPEEIYNNLVRVIAQVNNVCATNKPDWQDLDPRKGNILFGSGRLQWAFSIPKFAKIYSKKFGISEEILCERLWGDNYFDRATNKWSDQGPSSSRAFNQFVLSPIKKLLQALKTGDRQTYLPIIQKLSLNINIKRLEEDHTGDPKSLIRKVMSSWISASDCLFATIIKHLPSPVQAQNYRVDHLLDTQKDTVQHRSFKQCDPNGPLIIYVSKMVCIDRRFISFGRVYSGTARVGQTARVVREGSTCLKDTIQIKIPALCIMMSKNQERFSQIPCGNTLGIIGIQDAMGTKGTITQPSKQFYCMRNMVYTVSHVVRVGVSPSNAADLPKLINQIRQLAKTSNIKFQIQESGELVVSGCGELHIQVFMDQLRNQLRFPIKVTQPVVNFRETVTAASGPCLTKSQNNHNRLTASIQPMQLSLLQFMDQHSFSEATRAQQTKKLLQEFQMGKDQVAKIWNFGPQTLPTNMIINRTAGVQYLNQAKEHFSSSFECYSKSGALIQQPMRGVVLTVEDAQLHADAIHRGPGQLLPMMRKMLLGGQLKAEPRLVEPIFLAQIRVSFKQTGGIYQVLSKRRATVVSQTQLYSQSLIKAYIPVTESFGLNEALRSKTSGRAFTMLMFDHWETIESSPWEGKVERWVKAIRKRKGLKEQLSEAEEYLERFR